GVDPDRLIIVLNGAVILALEPIADAAGVECLGELLAPLPSRFDHGGTALDALINGHRVLALAPGALLRRLCGCRGAAQHDPGQDESETLCCYDSHRQLHRLRQSS